MLSTIPPFVRQGSRNNERPFRYTGGGNRREIPFDFTAGQIRNLDDSPFLFDSGSSPSSPSLAPSYTNNNGSLVAYTGDNNSSSSSSKRKRVIGRKQDETVGFTFPTPNPAGFLLPVPVLPIVPILLPPNLPIGNGTNKGDNDNASESIGRTATTTGTDSHRSNPMWRCHGSSGSAVPLGLAEDRSFLYELQVYLRSNVVEVFGASERDVSAAASAPSPAPDDAVELGRVGVRCRYCSQSSGTKDRRRQEQQNQQQQTSAVSFPTTIAGIYTSVQVILESHVEFCPSMPSEVREKIDSLIGCSANLGPREWYWIDSAKKLGLIDTNACGIRFGRDPEGRLPPLRGLSAAYMSDSGGGGGDGDGETRSGGRGGYGSVLPKMPSMPYIYTGGDIDEGWGNVPRDVAHVIVHSTVTHIDGGAFRSCKSLTTIEIARSVVSIGVRAFEGCTNLRNVRIPENVTSVGLHAFEGCSNLTTVQLSDNLVNIGAEAFRNCTNLTVVDVPSTGSSTADVVMEEQQQEGQRNDGPDITKPIALSSATVGQHAFSCCTSLTSITLPSTIAALGAHAFSGCTSLASIRLPEKTVRFPISAFERCSALRSIGAPPPEPLPARPAHATAALTTARLRILLAGAGFSPCPPIDTLYDRPVPSPAGTVYYRRTAVSAWAGTRDGGTGRLPLTIAAARSLRWRGGTERLFRVNMPAAYEVDDGVTGLPLFMLAGAGEGSDLESVFRLLREFPAAMMTVVGTGMGS